MYTFTTVVLVAIVLSCLVNLVKGAGWQWLLILFGFGLMLAQNICFNHLSNAVFESTNKATLIKVLSQFFLIGLAFVFGGMVVGNLRLIKSRDEQEPSA